MPVNLSELKLQNNVPIIMSNDRSVITFINKKFEEAYLWSSTMLIGKSLLTIIPRALHDAHTMGFSRFITTEAPTLLGKPLQLSILKADGSECTALHTIYGEKNNGEWIFLATIEPR